MTTIAVAVNFFAQVREQVGRKHLEVELPVGATVRDLWSELLARFPVLSAGPKIRVAVNQEYVDENRVLSDRDEVAIIPPVSGGGDLYALTERHIDVAQAQAAVASPTAGATVIFVGTTRDQSEGRAVEELEYEAYAEMAGAKMRGIGEEMRKRWDLVGIAMIHRVGRVPVGEASVVIAVSAAHRDEAFSACRFAIDTLKTAVPIWKKERYRDGSRWVG